jgi:2',3'-cyclic-nucleotide 2'-phosphodiesterase (5'-nucleotidase family)
VVSNRHVVKADENARSAQFVTVWGGKGKWRQATGLVPIDQSLPPDTAVARVVRTWNDSVARQLGPVLEVGRTTTIIEPSNGMARRRESLLGNLVTDAMRAGTRADVALINAGTLRLDNPIKPGPVTNHQLEAVFPFADQTRIVTFKTSGAGIRRILEHGVSRGVLGSGGFLQVSGLSFTYDPRRPSGNRIVGDIRRGEGTSLAPGDTVVVAFGAYTACDGGDGYRVPEAGAACGQRQAAPRAVDLLARYVTDSLKGRIEPPRGSRVVEAGNTNPG